MPILFLLFILVPIIEIGVFIQVGDVIGIGWTLLIVFITAVIGVNLLKQQGLRAWMDIQRRIAEGQLPALEMASAAQLLFAGGLLLTPGFVTDAVGFSLMIPSLRFFIARYLLKHWAHKVTRVSGQAYYQGSQSQQSTEQSPDSSNKQRTIEGEFEDRSDDR